MTIAFDPRARDALARTLAAQLHRHFDFDIAPMDAQRLLETMAELLGPHIYNQALADARARLAQRLEALDEAFYELEKPVKL